MLQQTKPILERRTSGHDLSRRERLEIATFALERTHPEYSAASPLTRGQKVAIATVIAMLALIATFGNGWGAHVVYLALSLAFTCVAAIRLGALVEFKAGTSPDAKVSGASHCEDPRELPSYTLLIALFQEADIVPETVSALANLRYPKEKLEILFLFEEDDHPTQQAFAAATLSPNMRAIVVPDGFPRTKPRALCYGMTFAQGDYIAVFDAEDLPDPDQLLCALHHFRMHPRLGCVQARLNIDNREKNWLTRQFAIEYTALFDALLPAFEKWNLPIPLGGTSNHVSRDALEQSGGWDPFNVTEDADLGIRLARMGWQVKTDTSTTWEEAPSEFKPWLRQRTRWIKGWMQTYLVHMRSPLQTHRDLGSRGFLGLQLLMAAQVLSPLVHPWALLITLANMHALITGGASHASVLETALVVTAGFNLLAGYGSGMALGLAAVKRRGFASLGPYIASMPVYWLLISIAAHRALLQMMSTRFTWEKTPHQGRSRRACKRG